MRILLTLAALALIGQQNPVAAQQAASPNPACMTLAQVLTILDGDKNKHVELSAQSLLGVSPIGLGAIVIATVHGQLVIGFEINGCVSSPVPVAPLPGGGIGT